MRDFQKKKGAKAKIKAEKQFQENKHLFKGRGQAAKQGGNLPRALGGHR